jgi:hypothetical protein
MRWIRRGNRKALKALVLSFAAMAILAGNANAAQVHDGGSIVPTFESITSVAQQYGGTAELPAAQQGEISYLSWGATAEHKLPFQSTREGGPVFMNGLPDGYVGSESTPGGVTPTNLARPYIQPVVELGGVTPTNLARAYVQPGMELSASQVDGSSWLPSDDLALGFGLGLILATAGAIALAMSRGRERIAHP